MNPDVKLDDFVEFFGKTKDELLKGLITKPDNSVKKYIYNDINPQCEKDARRMYERMEYAAMLLGEVQENFFSITENSVRTMEFAYANPKSGIPLDLAFTTAVKYLNKDDKILDYGCGQAKHSLTLYFMGYQNITLVDIPHAYFRFLEFLCKKYGINIKFIPLEGEFANIEKEYDYIICTDVLEHCWNPLDVLGHILSRLKNNKLIFLSDFYDDAQGTDPSHLKRNHKYQDVELKMREYICLGISPLLYDSNKAIKVWRKQ